MVDSFRVLFADDEETFLYSTSELLRRAGYPCDSAIDVNSARSLLQQNRYDLVITDLKMPGNNELQFARQLAQMSDEVSIILVTGHPSLSSAIDSLELPVVAYLIKPFEFQELVAKVRTAADRSRVRRVIGLELQRVKEYRRDLMNVEFTLNDHPRMASGPSLQLLIGRTLRSVTDGLTNLYELVQQQASHASEGSGRPGADMPHELQQALHDAVATLERTKSAFKSKELGELRKRLEVLLKN